MRAPITLLWLSLLTATAAAETAPACWMASDLAYHKGDERAHKTVTAIAPPRRILAEYSPIAQRGAVRRVKLTGDKKLVALTFDLCEQPSEISGYQGGIVDFLREHRIKATFFMGGKWMLSHRERAQQLMADPLFEVANHTWEHRNLRVVSGQALVDEIKNAQIAYEQVREELEAKRCTGPRGDTLAHEQAPRRLGLLRFPYGACSAAALDEAAYQGLLPVQWDVSSGDPAFAQSARAIEHRCSPTFSRARSFYSTPTAAGGTPRVRSPASSPHSKRAATNSPRFRSCSPRVSRWCRRRATTRAPATPTGLAIRCPSPPVHSASAGCGRVSRRLGRPRSAAGDGGLVAAAALFHDTRAQTAAMLAGVLRALKSHGYRLVHVVPAAER